MNNTDTIFHFKICLSTIFKKLLSVSFVLHNSTRGNNQGVVDLRNDWSL